VEGPGARVRSSVTSKTILDICSSTLIPSVAIHLVDQLPTISIPSDVFCQHLERPLRICITRAANMRRDQDIGCRPERIILGQRLRISHIESSTTDLVRLQRLNQRLLVNDLTPSNIRNISATRIALVQKLKLVSGEQMRCVFAAGV